MNTDHNPPSSAPMALTDPLVGRAPMTPATESAPKTLRFGLDTLKAFSATSTEGVSLKAGQAETLGVHLMRELWGRESLLVMNAALLRQKLFERRAFREAKPLDLLELFAFVRPAEFCAPSIAGLCQKLGLSEPQGLLAQAQALLEAAEALLLELSQAPVAFRLMAWSSLRLMAQNDWPWAPYVKAALDETPLADGYVLPPPLWVWSLLEEWEDEAPRGQPRSVALSPEDIALTLKASLERAKLKEVRPEQEQFASLSRSIFEAKYVLDQPNMWLIEAGTGVGKTLGYLAPAQAWAEKSQGQVWISTYTRALQKQIYKDAGALFDTEAQRQSKVVVRKGRENYLCLLNYQERITALNQTGPEMILAALLARWILYSRDGDILGGDFPTWLPHIVPPQALSSVLQALHPSQLIDRRGECIHSACSHYRVCFVEKSIRKSKQAEIVIANHALVMAQAAYDYQGGLSGAPDPHEAAEALDGEVPLLSRLIFDEGHHVFEAADQAFSTHLSGYETYELRRWIRGNEGRGRRSRGLEARLGDILAGREEALSALKEVMRHALSLPSEGWSQRLTTLTQSGELMKPMGPFEALFIRVQQQIDLRQEGPKGAQRFSDEAKGAECEAYPCLPEVSLAASEAKEALVRLEVPLKALVRALEDILTQDKALDPQERVRLDGALRGLQRRARLQIPAWRHLLEALIEGQEPHPEPEAGEASFVDWFSQHVLNGRLVDIQIHRHFIDPSRPFADYVLKPAHGVLMASATLSDQTDSKDTEADGFALAKRRTGAQHLIMGAKVGQIASPFDYAAQARLFVITDIERDDVKQVAAALLSLFQASGGGGLGLFTAIRRLRSVYQILEPRLNALGLPLYAQHVDPMDVSDLIDMFRAEPHSCLLGTDAVRDGIDVPGQALRLIAFDRVPWPRPDALHKARRAHFGQKLYDDSLVRARLAQAFGRLIRKRDDKGVFVLLDKSTPTRLLASIPKGVVIQRVSLSEALGAIETFLHPDPALKP